MVVSREAKMARKLEKLSHILLVALALYILPVGAYIYDFEDGVGHGWNNEGKTDWYLDQAESHDGYSSLRSGDIRCTGTSSVYRYVEGPAEISFWWKKNPSSGPSGKNTVFTFSVNGIVQQTCDFSDWRKESYSITKNGTYEIRWDFKKIACYPQSEVAGWIDEVEITPETISGIVESLDVNISELRLEIELLRGDVSDLNATTNSLILAGICPTEINESLCLKCMEISGVGSELVQLNRSIDSLEFKVRAINNTLIHTNISYTVQLKQIAENQTALEENVTKMNNTIKFIDSYLLNLNNTINETISRIDTAECLRCDNRICVGPNDSLNDIINLSSYKVLYLEDGIYNGPIYIGKNVTNITIKSMNKWGAIINASNADYVIKLEDTSMVSIQGVIITNGKSGIIIKDSDDCKIEENAIFRAGECGIKLLNSKCNIIAHNKIEADDGERSVGIYLNGSDRNLILYNDISTQDTDLNNSVYRYLIGLENSSSDNTICNINDGIIKELNNTHGIKFNDMEFFDELECEINEGNYVCRCFDNNIDEWLIDINDYSLNKWCCVDYYIPLNYSKSSDY